jgi:hypothetical protein
VLRDLIAEPIFGRTRTGEQGCKKQKFRSMLRNFRARRRDGADGLGHRIGELVLLPKSDYRTHLQVLLKNVA